MCLSMDLFLIFEKKTDVKKIKWKSDEFSIKIKNK